MASSSIEWTDSTWNPVSGCTMVSEGCRFCYAVTMTKRLESMGKPKYAGLVNIGKGHFNGTVKCHEDALTIPLKARKPRRWFVNSMSDLFHREVPFEFIDKVFAVMALTPHHTYQILTKRPERMAEYLAENRMIDGADPLPEALDELMKFGATVDGMQLADWLDAQEFQQFNLPLPNVWLGTSVEDQATADERIPHLLRCPAAVRFLSCEPLLGPVDLTNIDHGEFFGKHDVLAGRFMPGDKPMIHWVIVGGESGPGARPMHPDWARSLRDQCVSASVPFFFKQWGEWALHETIGHDAYWKASHRGVVMLDGELKPIKEGPATGKVAGLIDIASGGDAVAKVGKKKGGRILDGRTWDEFPEDSRGK